MIRGYEPAVVFCYTFVACYFAGAFLAYSSIHWARPRGYWRGFMQAFSWVAFSLSVFFYVICLWNCVEH